MVISTKKNTKKVNKKSIKSKKSKKMKIPTFRIICLCTPNYNKIGKYGVNSLYAYCKKHGYKFSLYDKKLDDDLHINFTKNYIMIDALKKYKEDFIVLIDADIEIVDSNIKLEDTFKIKKNVIFYAPLDLWGIFDYLIYPMKKI